MTIKKTGAVTQSVANTAKRVIVIVGGESVQVAKRRADTNFDDISNAVGTFFTTLFAR